MKRFFNRTFITTAAAMFATAGFVSIANREIESQVQQAARHNFAAASLVTRIQVHGERMRRYEKEMFIYAAVPDKRAKYVKEFDAVHTGLLGDLNAALASQNKGFSDGDRQKVKGWLEATSFYGNEFRKVVAAAEFATPEQQAGLTTRLNADIGPGKDRFRALLDGAAAMREEKLQASVAIGDEISASKRHIDYVLFGSALLVSALVFIFTSGGGNAAAKVDRVPSKRNSAFGGLN